jgi:hypothetical protein
MLSDPAAGIPKFYQTPDAKLVTLTQGELSADLSSCRRVFKMVSNHMDLSVAITSVDEFLHNAIKPSGTCGFEGLVATLIQEATGQEFRLSSSGRQSGRDAASESGYANHVKIETKHYLETTALKPRELIAEIHEAAKSDLQLDLWVLAASRAVSEQIEVNLNNEAELFGIDVVVLDFGTNGLPRLVVLIAAFPELVRAWAFRHAIEYDADRIDTALGAIASECDFDSAKSRLFAKLNSASGYDAARRRIEQRFSQAVTSSANSRAMFRQRLGIREPGTVFIHRVEVCRQLDGWWDGESTDLPAIVLGEDGTGKTWAVFDWVLRRAAAGDMPIVLPLAVSAQQINRSDTLESVLPRLMEKWTGLLDERRWKRKLERWLTSGRSNKPLILLILDGLNERADLSWPPLFASVLGEPWRGNVAVIATDRPHHWKNKCSFAGFSEFHEIPVGGYSEPELDHALAASHLSHRDIPEGLLPLVSIPRYCGLVARHHTEMVASGDFTKARLIYTDIRERQGSHLGYPLNEQQLLTIIRDLADRARANPELDWNELRQLINLPGGDEANIYEEIVGGGLLVPFTAVGGIERYKVHPLRLAYGFGMLLATEVGKAPNATEADTEEFLASWFEPQPDMDLKVDICGSAMFHALFQAGFPESPLRGLVRYWLGLRNWADTAHFALAGYVLRCPQVFLDIAEEFWSSSRDNGAAQEFLRYAFMAQRDHPSVQPLLARSIQRWMGFIHPLGHDYWTFDQERIRRSRRVLGQMSGQPVAMAVEQNEKEERVRHEIESRAGCTLKAGEIEVAGLKLVVISDGVLLRLARFGLMLMSGGDPTPFISSLASWAVASAVMGHSDAFEVAAWVVRLSEQPVDNILLEQARRLLTRQEETATSAARTLLFLIGSKDSESLITEFHLTPEWYTERRAQHEKDPCTSLLPWTDSECTQCIGREDVPLHIILDRAKLLLLDPDVSVPQSLTERALSTLRSVDPAHVRAASSFTSETHQLETVKGILCARAPSEIAEFFRNVIVSMADRDTTGRYYLAIQLPEMSLLLKDREVMVIKRVATELSRSSATWTIEPGNGSRQMEQLAEARAFAAIAPHLGPLDLFRDLIARSANALDLTTLELWFGRIPGDEARAMLSLLHSPPHPAILYRALWALPAADISLSETDRDRLAELAESDDTRARSGAFRVAVVGHDETLGRQMIDQGLILTAGMGPWEETWATRLLIAFGQDLTFEDIAKRLRLWATSFVIETRGNHCDELGIYVDCLDRKWWQIVSAADPEIGSLPEIEIGTYPNDIGLMAPQLREPETSQTIRLDRARSWTSGPPIDASVELSQMFSADYQQHQVEQANETRRRKADAIFAAWQTDAFQLYGQALNLATMDLLYEHYPERIEKWVETALTSSELGFTVRMRLGGLLEPICRVLLKRNAQRGLSLWQMLRDRQASPVVFNTLDIAFCGESGKSDVARQIVLDNCWNDIEIARVATASGRWKRTEWLKSTVEELVSSAVLWKKAKGLTLASFADTPSSEFEDLISRAEVENTWIEQCLPSLRENVRKNDLARRWYRIFLSADDRDTAWGALQIVLAQADSRLLNWCEEVERSSSNEDLTRERLRFLAMECRTRGYLRKTLDRDNERRERLFGLTIQPGELGQFM